MKSNQPVSVSKVLWFIFFLTLGLASVYYTYHKYDLKQLLSDLRIAKISWYVPVLLATIVCHWSRSARWKLLLTASGERVTLFQSLIAVMCGYFINFITPRFGEVFRCLVLRNHAAVPFEKSLATVITERIVDVSCLGVLLVASLLVYGEQIQLFAMREVLAPLQDVLASKMYFLFGFLILLLLIIVSAWLLYKYMRQWQKKIHAMFIRFVRALTSVARMKRKGLFLFHTILIWFMYLLMTYFWFFGLSETVHLSLMDAMLVISFGGIARSLPIQAYGMGVYQYMVWQILLLLGIHGDSGKLLGTIIYSGQTLFYLLAGGLCFLYYLLFVKKSLRAVAK